MEEETTSPDDYISQKRDNEDSIMSKSDTISDAEVAIIEEEEIGKCVGDFGGIMCEIVILYHKRRTFSIGL